MFALLNQISTLENELKETKNSLNLIQKQMNSSIQGEISTKEINALIKNKYFFYVLFIGS